MLHGVKTLALSRTIRTNRGKRAWHANGWLSLRYCLSRPVAPPPLAPLAPPCSRPLGGPFLLLPHPATCTCTKTWNLHLRIPSLDNPRFHQPFNPRLRIASRSEEVHHAAHSSPLQPAQIQLCLVLFIIWQRTTALYPASCCCILYFWWRVSTLVRPDFRPPVPFFLP